MTNRFSPRRFLRQELERIKLGNSLAAKDFLEYGIERDHTPESLDGWKWMEGKKELGIDTHPFWDAIKAGKYGINEHELGKFGDALILSFRNYWAIQCRNKVEIAHLI